MKATRIAALGVLSALLVSGAVLLAADIEIAPRTLVVGQKTRIELAVDPNRLWPKPRSEILYAWWCWDIDPRPPECEQHYCDSPVPDDPICALPKKESADRVIFDFDPEGLVDKARGSCGRTGFVLKAKLADGGVSEAKGSLEIECEK